MIEERHVTLRILHNQKVRPKYGQKFEPAQLIHDVPVMIRSIDPEDAPVAYRVHSNAAPLDTSSRDEYVIRCFEGGHWWPARWNGRSIDPNDFVNSANGASGHAAAMIDPMPGLYSGFPPKDIISFHPDKIRETSESDLESRLPSIQRRAAHVIFCGDEVFADAGAPVFYAVSAAGGLDLKIGPSRWNRLIDLQLLPGPSHKEAIDSVRRGHVFAIEDAAAQASRLSAQGQDVRCYDRADATDPERRSDAVIQLRMRSLAEDAYAGLRNDFQAHERALLVPSLFDPGGQRRFDDDIVWRNAIEDLVEIKDPKHARWLRKYIDAARNLIAEVNTSSALSVEEDDALMALSH